MSAFPTTPVIEAAADVGTREATKRQAIAMYTLMGYSKTDGMLTMSLALVWLKLGWI